jgi:hypothetical protein
MAFGFPAVVRNALLDALVTYAGSGAILKIFSGSRPATGGAETTKLAQLTFSGNIAAAASSGALTLNIPPSDTSAGHAGPFLRYPAHAGHTLNSSLAPRPAP